MPAIDYRAYLTPEKKNILNIASELMFRFPSMDEGSQNTILSTGYYKGYPLDRYLSELLQFSSSALPEDTYGRLYYNAFKKRYSAQTKRKGFWEQASTPLEQFFVDCSRYPTQKNILNLVLTDTSHIEDPNEKLLAEQHMHELQQQYYAEMAATQAQMQTKVDTTVRQVTPLTDSQKISQIANPLEHALLTILAESSELTEEQQREKLKNLHFFFDEEIDFLIENKGTMSLGKNATRKEIEEWRQKVREAARIMYKERKKELTDEPPTTLESPSDTTPPTVSPPAPETSQGDKINDRFAAIRQEADAIAAKAPTPYVVKRSAGGFSAFGPAAPAVSPPEVVVPKTTVNPLIDRSILSARQIKKKVSPRLKTVGDTVGSKVREVVRNHPRTAVATASGVAGGLVNTLINGPFGFFGGFLVGAAMPQVISQGFNELTNRQEPAQAVPQREPLRWPSRFLNRPRRATQAANLVTNVGKKALLRSPWFWLVVGIILLILLIFLVGGSAIRSILNPFDEGATSTGTGTLKIVKTGPAEVEDYNVGDKISYTITVTYTGTGNANGVVKDTLPENTKFSKSTPTGTVNGNIVTWNLSNLSPNASQTINLEAEVTKSMDNLWLINTVEGSTLASSGGGFAGGSCPSDEQIKANRADRNTCVPLNPAIPLYDNGITEEQIQKYIELNIHRHPAGREDMERKARYIVQKAQQAGFNPIIYLGLWITESGTGTGMGCDPWGGNFPTFEQQVDCATGLVKGGSVAIACAKTKDANSKECQDAAGIVNSAANASIYEGVYKPNIPIATFDDFNKLYGPLSPNLAKTEGVLNNNCINTYNTLIEVAKSIGGCITAPAGSTIATNLSSCKFYRPDQKPGSSLCVPVSEGFRCEEAVTYKSGYLLSIFEEASKKSGVPAAVLAGVARFESTVPLSVSATGKSYSLADYTDDDIRAMEEFSKTVSFDTIDKTINGSSKALCPRSPTGATSIVQVQPPDRFINEYEKRNLLKIPGQPDSVNTTNASIARTAHADPGLEMGAKFIDPNLTIDKLTLEHFCNPRTGLLLGAGVMLYKTAGVNGKWNPPSDAAGQEQYIKNLGEAYYGKDANTKQYIDGLWQSVKECKPAS